VSHSHEPSYYEIALTNRQVLIVFVVLLICVVAAFFSGVWVGRRDAPVGMSEVASGPVDTAEGEAEDGVAVGELHFFADREGPAEQEPSLAEIAEAPKPGTTLLEDVAGNEPEAAAAEPPPVVEESVGKAAVAETAPLGSYVIQVFSSADEVQARRLLKQLNDGGFPAFLSPVEVGNQTMMRVRIGPYSELASAESVAERIRREFKLDTWVTR
jgi:cell division septation protein DedD